MISSENHFRIGPEQEGPGPAGATEPARCAKDRNKT
jgi:hypothetical protein